MLCPACRNPFTPPPGAPASGGRCPACAAVERAQTVQLPPPDLLGGSLPAGAPLQVPAGETIVGPPVPAALPLAEGAFFGRFLLVRLLGEGGMGVVWQAWDTELDRTVALKLIRADETFRDTSLPRFLREARLAGKLRHAGIVGVYDVGQCEGRHFISMDYVEGDTLEQRLFAERTATLAVGDAIAGRLRADVELLAGVAEAVGYAHAQGIVHRDLKPSNVVIDKEGRPRVMDFGLAKDVAGSSTDLVQNSRVLTLAGQAVGTPSYMAPEQASGDHPATGPHTDVWALGVMLFEILTGRLPFVRDSVHEILQAIVDGEPPAPGAVAKEVPEELETVCLRALHKEEARRYANAGEFAAELRRWLKGEPVLARREAASRKVWRWVARRRSIAVPALAAAALLAAALGWTAYERASAASRTRALLAEVAAAVTHLEDALETAPLTDEARRELVGQPFAQLEQVLRDDPSCGAALAWRGRVHELLGEAVEAEADFDRACALSPGASAVWFLRGMHRVQCYGVARGAPGFTLGTRGFEFETLPPEMPEQRTLREAGLADLARAERPEGAQAWEVSAPDLTLGRAMAVFYSGRPDAYAETVRLVAADARPLARRLAGAAAYMQCRWDEAIGSFGRAVTAWPLDVYARHMRAMAHEGAALAGMAAGRDPFAHLEAALADVDALAGRQPSDWGHAADRGNVLTWRAKAETACGRDPRDSLGKAIEAFGRALGLAPNNLSVVVNRAAAYRRLAEVRGERGEDPRDCFRAAVADCTEVLRLQPGNAGAYNNRGMTYKTIATYELMHGTDARPDALRATGDFDAALKISPADALVRNNRGLARTLWAQAEEMAGGDPTAGYREAIADLDAALAARPDFGDARLSRATAWEGLAAWEGDHGRDAAASWVHALADFDAALQANPESAMAYNNRANAWQARAKQEATRGLDAGPSFERALADYGDCLKRNPEYWSAYHNRANAYQARATWEAALGQDPEASLHRAIEDYGSAVKRNAAFVHGLVSRGVTWLWLAQIDEGKKRDERESLRSALADIDAALAVNPRRADAWQARGLVRHSLARAAAARGEDPREEYAKGLADFDAALRCSPGMALAVQNRARMCLDWARHELARADRAVAAGKLEDARAGYALGFQRLEEHFAAFAPAERSQREAEPTLRATRSAAHYNAGCVEARLGNADAAFGELWKAVELGYRDRGHMEGDADLAGLRGDARWAELVGRMK